VRKCERCGATIPRSTKYCFACADSAPDAEVEQAALDRCLKVVLDPLPCPTRAMTEALLRRARAAGRGGAERAQLLRQIALAFVRAATVAEVEGSEGGRRSLRGEEADDADAA